MKHGTLANLIETYKGDPNGIIIFLNIDPQRHQPNATELYKEIERVWKGTLNSLEFVIPLYGKILDSRNSNIIF
jgi:hypothetical protein